MTEKERQLKAIKELEKRSGVRLMRVTHDVFQKYINYFCLDEWGQVTHLDILRSELSDLSPLANLTGLTRLELRSNKITDLSPFAHLTGLTKLVLESNRITDLSPLANLTRLSILYLGYNQITDLSPLATLTGLTTLALMNNQITDLSPLATLTGLTTLNLASNQITDLSPLLPLIPHKKLKSVYLSKNQIKHLPPDFLKLDIPINWENDWDKISIHLSGNPLETPPIEIVKQGHEAIVSYFKQLEAEKRVQFLQCKLLIVGQGEVGKTSLMKKLKNPSTPLDEKEPTTHGINIIPWELRCNFAQGGCLSSVSVSERSASTPSTMSDCTVKLYFWDFGGQDIYHSTHQFFLTRRSVYILVWEARKEEEANSFNYWLNVIKLLGSGSPIIVVMNKADIRIKTTDQFTLQKKFPDIKGFLNISCKDNTGLPELTKLITDTLGQMPHLRDLLPASWLHIRDELQTLDKNYISLDQFSTIFEKHNIEKKDAVIIADYLHDLGSILYFRHDPVLAHTIIIKPEWATKAVYALLDAIPIIKNKGKFNLKDLETYWDTELYPVSIHPQLIRLMEKFELCFNFIHTDDYFIPELLPGSILEFDQTRYYEPGVLHFQYKYEFMPEGILSRFIARLYYLIHDQRFRKYGVELAFDRSHALIVSETANNLISIHITGGNKSELLAIIRNDFNHIHQTLNMTAGTHYNEMLPCCCSSCSQIKEPEQKHYFQYGTLIQYLVKNRKTITCPKEVEDVEIETLLKGFSRDMEKETIFNAVIDACTHIQGLSMSMKPDEDSRTNLLCVLLNQKGFFVKDHAWFGLSETHKSMGRLDAMLETEEGTRAVIEAFLLPGFNTNTITSHCKKIFGYDPVGFENNYVIVYCDCDPKKHDKFPTLWEKYKQCVREIDFEDYPMQSLEEIPVKPKEMLAARAIHSRSKKETGIYHIFIHMGVS